MKNKKTSLRTQLILIAIVPMLALSVILTIAGITSSRSAISSEVKTEMSNLSKVILSDMDEMYRGDYYALTDAEGAIYMFKGEHQLNGDFEYIDEMKKATGCDISFCYLNVSVITTLKNKDGERKIGNSDSVIVVGDVIETNEAKFYDDVRFDKEKFLAYYVPLHDATGQVVGMLQIAKSASEVDELSKKAAFPIFIIAIIATLVAAYIFFRYSNKLTDTIAKIKKYLGHLAKGEFEADIHQSVLDRKDELADIGKSAEITGHSLREKVEEDQLTKLLNRRSAYRKFDQTIESFTKQGIRFCVALGDVDFFKKVNDTYGHDAGDKVLIEVSRTLKNFMQPFGYAIRWGGEEFLLVFAKVGNIEVACNQMEDLLDRIRALEIEDEGRIIKVTMTFGIVECNDEEDTMDFYVNSADAKLYYGKEHGRNQLVYTMGDEANSLE